MEDKWVDVSNEVTGYNIDGENCSITNCPKCKKEFRYWEFVLGVYKDDPDVCPNCGAMMYYSSSIKVFVKEQE